MKLYVFPPSPRAHKVLAVANHLGIDYEPVIVNLVAGDQRKPEYLELNPNGRMPVMDDDGYVLWESNSIMQYLADQQPGKLLPVDGRGRFDVTRWQFWDAAHWDPACAILLFENVVKGIVGAGKPDPVRVKEGQERLAREASVLDAHLARHQWIAGDALSIADFGVSAPLFYAGSCGIDLSRYPHIADWFGRVSGLDSWKKAAPQPIAA